MVKGISQDFSEKHPGGNQTTFGTAFPASMSPVNSRPRFLLLCL